MINNCLVCERISKILQGENKYFVKELETGYVVMGDFQFYHGYTVFVCKEHKMELHELESGFRLKFLKEMSEVAEAVFIAFKPEKINYELLGNADTHMHWHIFPRHKNDPLPEVPIWCLDKSIRCASSARPTDEDLKELRTKLLEALNIKSGH